jgi:hypothetical protein
MEPDRSIQITWPLAAQEAILGEFQHIEPSHLFLAALKFAEVEEEQMQTVAGNAGVAKELLAVRDSLHDLLRTYSIGVPGASRPIRRNLRKQLGRGGHPHDGRQVIHRSGATREVFKKAEEIARTANAQLLTTSHLLQALFESPPKEVQAALAVAGIRITKPRPNTPTLNKYGRDLFGLAGDPGHGTGPEPSDDPMKDAVCKVIIEFLANQQKKGVLLIQKGKRTPEQVAKRLALHLGQSSAQPIVPITRIIEIDITTESWQVIAGQTGMMEATMKAIFNEGRLSADLAFFFKGFPDFFTSVGGKKCLALIREEMSKGTPCIAGTDEAGYRTYVDKDREWKNVLQPVWIHDLDLPFRL